MWEGKKQYVSILAPPLNQIKKELLMRKSIVVLEVRCLACFPMGVAGRGNKFKKRVAWTARGAGCVHVRGMHGAYLWPCLHAP